MARLGTISRLIQWSNGASVAEHSSRMQSTYNTTAVHTSKGNVHTTATTAGADVPCLGFR